MAHVNKYPATKEPDCECIYPCIYLRASERKKAIIVLNKLKKLFNIDVLLIPSISPDIDLMVPVDGSEHRDEWPKAAISFLKKENVSLEGPA